MACSRLSCRFLERPVPLAGTSLALDAGASPDRAEETPSVSLPEAFEHELAGLSMGMSSDFETAVQLGATHVRVGSALFGTRG